MKKWVSSIAVWAEQNRDRVLWIGGGLALIVVVLLLPSLIPPAHEEPPQIEIAIGPNDRMLTLVGQVTDTQGSPLAETEVSTCSPDQTDQHSWTAESQGDGSFRLEIPITHERVDRLIAARETMCLSLEHPNFTPVELTLAADSWVTEDDDPHILLPVTVMEHRIGGAFWFATLVFVVTMGFIATERLHKTVAALAGAALILIVSQIAGLFDPAWNIMGFEGAMESIDFEVIFLLIGMMIFVGMVEETGLFQWMAFRAYKAAGGSPWRLTIILVVITAVASALLDNVTTVLLMTPITIEIALKIGINPIAILVPEVLASNIGGTATLVGSPPTILIGTGAGLSFGDFLVETGPVVVVVLVILLLYMRRQYGSEYEVAEEIDSAALMTRLEEDARITQPAVLRRGLLVGAGMIGLFLVGPQIKMVPALIALGGAAALLIWIRPDMERAVRQVDWTTLLFFMGLFMQVGALEEVGLIAKVAEAIADIAGNSLVIAVLVTLWPALIMSAIIDNVPFAAAMLPVAHYLTASVPGAEGGIIYWALVFGACFGGNATLIGASANLVAAGIAERAGYPITYERFLRVGAPMALAGGLIATGWLLLQI